MKRFPAICALALAAAAAHAQSPVPATSEPVAAMFKAWDASGDGQLSPAEFRAGWRRLQVAAKAQAALERQLAVLDADRDHAIGAGEYANLALVRDAGKRAPPLARFDADGDGKLQFAEYVKLVETLAPQQQARKDGTK